MAEIALEFTTTACNRPGILDLTYSSNISEMEKVAKKK